MSFNSQLAQTMAGIYRNSDTFNLYPQASVPDWQVLYAHEFMHAALALSTSTGFVHHLFAFLSAAGDDGLRPYWEKVYSASIQISTETHESTATFWSLCDVAAANGLEKTFKDYGLPLEYQKWYKKLDLVIPYNLPMHLRKLIARAIGSYALDDPLTLIKSATWDELLDFNKCMSFVPTVDARFDKLIQLLSAKDYTFWSDRLPATAYDEIVIHGEESIREFMARRREESHIVFSSVLNILWEEFEGEVQVLRSSTRVLSLLSDDITSHLRKIFSEKGDESLNAFSRVYEDLPGPDHLHFDCAVLRPNKLLSGLIRIDIIERLPSPPSVVSITRATEDCYLSKNLILKGDEYYTRYFFVSGQSMAPFTFYSITREFPVQVWKFVNAIIIVHCFHTEAHKILEDINRSVDVPIFLYLDRMTKRLFESIIDDSQNWQFGLIGWSHCPGIYSLWLRNALLNCIWMADISTIQAEIFDEDARRAGMARLDSKDPFFQRCLSSISAVFDFIGCSEGVPIRPKT